MPKLSSKVVEDNKLHIEGAAQELFIRRGFHATPMRAIAARAGVSLGNLYNYYRTKEGLLESMIGRHQQVIDERLRAMFAELDEPFRPESLAGFGRQVRALVHEHSDYWRLMYIDVMEFENRHFRKMFEGLARKLRRQFAGYFERLEREGKLYGGNDPAVGFTAAYMQFFNYFLVEKLFGGKRHFGIGDDEVIAGLTEIFCRGVLHPDEVERLRAGAGGLSGGGRAARRGGGSRRRQAARR